LYVVPFPPVAIVAVIGAGIEPKQMVCDVLVMVLEAIVGITVTNNSVVVSALQTPDITFLLNQVVCVKELEVKFCVESIPPAFAYPVVALVMLFNHL
jgi:hypothetical protein